MITDEQITKAADEGTMVNIDILAHWCDQAGFPFFLGLAILQKESRGKNVYGHDAGGALSGYPELVTEENYRLFRWLVDVGQLDSTGKPVKSKSNGVGPFQLTWSGYFPQLDKLGLKPWIADDTIQYAVTKILAPSFRGRPSTVSDREAFRQVANAYNTGKYDTTPATYATDALVVADRWAKVVGTSDTLIRWSA